MLDENAYALNVPVCVTLLASATSAWHCQPARHMNDISADSSFGVRSITCRELLRCIRVAVSFLPRAGVTLATLLFKFSTSLIGFAPSAPLDRDLCTVRTLHCNVTSLFPEAQERAACLALSCVLSPCFQLHEPLLSIQQTFSTQLTQSRSSVLWDTSCKTQTSSQSRLSAGSCSIKRSRFTSTYCKCVLASSAATLRL